MWYLGASKIPLIKCRYSRPIVEICSPLSNSCLHTLFETRRCYPQLHSPWLRMRHPPASLIPYSRQVGLLLIAWHYPNEFWAYALGQLTRMSATSSGTSRFWSIWPMWQMLILGLKFGTSLLMWLEECGGSEDMPSSSCILFWVRTAWLGMRRRKVVVLRYYGLPRGSAENIVCKSIHFWG